MASVQENGIQKEMRYTTLPLEFFTQVPAPNMKERKYIPLEDSRGTV